MRIVILSTRISGTDGVSLEAEHWREILEKMGHKVTFVAGKLDRSGLVIPELHFNWSKVVELHDKVILDKGKYKQVEAEIFEVAGKIEGKLREVFNRGKKIDLLIVANALSLPMHFPLAVALSRVIDELKIPTIARHHDFWWERKRFIRSTMFDFFKRWFPPDLPNVKHVVINCQSKEALKERTGIVASVFGDSFDFNCSLNNKDSFSDKFRSDFGIKRDDLVFLQATRIIPRKRIELSIDLIKKLSLPNAILVIAGHSGDEGNEYKKKIKKLAKDLGIRHIFIGNYVNSVRKVRRGRRIYTLWDCYMNADFITYPTKLEGFGNQFVESVFFKKPVILTPYPVFKKDIMPLGFETIVMPDRVSKSVIEKVNGLISNPKETKRMVEKNFLLGKKHFSYQATEKKLENLFQKMKLEF